jgi:lysophospholipase L1-like esterase
MCGEVTRDMVLRFRQDVLVHRPDYVVILGGTNDLGWHVTPAEILSNLVCMYEQALGAGIQPVAVTIPSIRMEVDPAAEQWLNELVTQRQQLNKLIAEYCAKNGIACVDLFAATAEANTLLLAGPYSNDGLHLTTEGYRKMADLLYEQVFQSRVLGQN